MKITVFGAGYVGLVTGTCFAEMGNDVTCVDVDAEKVLSLQKGKSPIYEPGLDDLLERNLREGRLVFSTQSDEAIQNSDLLFIAVGTPPDEDGSADLSAVLDVASQIGQRLQSYKLVVVKSTVPVGTHQKVRAAIEASLRKRGVLVPFDVCSNPEFLREGCAIEDSLRPHRVIVGVDTDTAARWMTRLYEPFLKDGNPLLVMDPFSSEMAKYAANAMLATKISFMNEMSRLCERVGADVEQVRRGIGSDPRIGPHFIAPGLGYGGSCFPKDVQALIRVGDFHDVNLGILKSVEEANQLQKTHFFSKVRNHFHDQLSGRKIAVWGVAFKAGTDDIREAPALLLIRRLLKSGAIVSIYDPVALENALWYFRGHENLRAGHDPYDVLEGADALIVCTEWPVFHEPDFARVKTLLRSPTIFDGRNMYSPELMRDQGFHYICVGRPKLRRPSLQRSVELLHPQPIRAGQDQNL